MCNWSHASFRFEMPDNEAKVFSCPLSGCARVDCHQEKSSDSSAPRLSKSKACTFPAAHQLGTKRDHTGLFLLKPPQVVRHTFAHFCLKSATLPISPAIHCGLRPCIQPSLTLQCPTGAGLAWGESQGRPKFSSSPYSFWRNVWEWQRDHH